MPKMIVSIDGVVIKEVQLTKDRTTLGRRPYNDIVIDNLAVSGEHAVLQMTGNEVYLEDLNSTNGTYVNGKAVKKQLLQNSDTVEIGKYKIKYINEVAGPTFEKTMIIKAGSVMPPPPVRADAAAAAAPAADLSGSRTRGAADQSCDHHRLARRGRGGHHQAAPWFRSGARRRRQQAHPQRRGHQRRTGDLEERRPSRAGRHADAVCPGLIAPGAHSPGHDKRGPSPSWACC